MSDCTCISSAAHSMTCLLNTALTDRDHWRARAERAEAQLAAPQSCPRCGRSDLTVGDLQEADAFASAFLMPRGSVLAAAPRLPNLDLLVKLKRNWNVSVAALAHRLHALNLLSDWHYRTICIEIAQRGYKRAEPNGIARETSQLLQKVFQALRDDGLTKPVIARQLHLDPNELDSLVFGLVMTPLQGGGAPKDSRSGRGHLRLV